MLPSVPQGDIAMPAELSPAALRIVFARLGATAEGAIAAGLEPLATAVERQAKINASTGQHRRNTPTPAHPGAGPARISGTLVRSITHSRPERTADRWECKIGTATGLYAPYNRRTPANRYGYYLEHGLRNGARYPFLQPAAHMVAHISAYVMFAEAFRRAGWSTNVR